MPHAVFLLSTPMIAKSSTTQTCFASPPKPIATNVRIISEFFATRFEAIYRRMDRVRRIAQVESLNFRPTRAPVQIALIWRGANAIP